MNERIQTRWKLIAVAAVVLLVTGVFNVMNLVRTQGDVVSFVVIYLIMIIVLAAFIYLLTKAPKAK